MPTLCHLVAPIYWLLKHSCVNSVQYSKKFYNCIVPMGFPQWEIWAAFLRESQLQQSCYLTYSACWVFSVSVIYQTLTWTKGSLTCTQILMHVIAHWGVRGHRRRACAESWLWEKNPLPHLGIEPASAACWSDALPIELHLHPSN